MDSTSLLWRSVGTFRVVQLSPCYGLNCAWQPEVVVAGYALGSLSMTSFTVDADLPA